MNCKPGDMARVAFCPMIPESEGGIVSVLHSDECCSGWWICLALSAMYGRKNGRLVRVAPGEKVNCQDKYLRPIDGGETNEESAAAMRDLYSIPSEVTA